MKMALKQAYKAAEEDEVPIGAVIVRDGNVIARARNKKEKYKCSNYHAEIVAIEKACKKIGDWRLNECDIFVTLEPCAMCSGALINARIGKHLFRRLRSESGVLFYAVQSSCGQKIQSPSRRYRRRRIRGRVRAGFE